MTTRGTQIAVAIAVTLVLLVPKSMPCSHPDEDCSELRDHKLCRAGDTEPLGIYFLEKLLRRDLGIAYSTKTVCD